MNGRDLYDKHFELIERIIEITGRYRLAEDDKGDFRNHVHMRLLENDCRILCNFRGESAIKPYLAGVTKRQLNNFLGYRGFRNCTIAIHLGEAAMLLEKLTHGDKLTFDQACEVILTNYKDKIKTSRKELEGFWNRLPIRPSYEVVLLDDLDAFVFSILPDTTLDREELKEKMEKARKAIQEVLAKIPPEERRVFKLRFFPGMKITRIMAVTGYTRKKIDYCLQKNLERLRKRLKKEGICREDLQDIIGKDWDDRPFDISDEERDSKADEDKKTDLKTDEEKKSDRRPGWEGENGIQGPLFNNDP